MPKARDLIQRFAGDGRYHFDLGDVRDALGVSDAAARLAVNRLAKQGLVASPARGFYVIVPPEYCRPGCLPADQFIPALMERLRLKYYAGLLSAAQYHGAAHHRPQHFQVMLARNRRPISCGAVRVTFIARKGVIDVPVERFNTPRGTIFVSSVEATAVDLVGYGHRAGGLDQVATVLSELAERIDPDRLVVAARSAPTSWAQRLGYLLELVGEGEKVAALRSYVKETARDATPLGPAGLLGNAARARDWKVWINAEVEAET